ncbi:MAG: type III pantothenate kinase [Candidatus Krumholzibacteriota bacterium]|nr:type III pantothenate kinase [Candidatus Krumholzibacteriota bacterium]
MSRTLLIDRGNRSLKAALVREGHIVDRREGASNDAAIVKSMAAAADRAVLSCVVPAALAAIRGALAEAGLPVVEAGAQRQLPFPLLVERPDRLGADRIAAACGAAALGLEEAVIVDAGTAVTVDCLSRRGFLGGTIFPGPALLLSSLHRGTGALPELDTIGQDAPLPGRSTREAIAAGVLRGLAAAVRGLVDASLAVLGDNVPVLLTGGAAGPAGAGLGPETRREPDLIFLGLELIGQMNGPGASN